MILQIIYFLTKHNRVFQSVSVVHTCLKSVNVIQILKMVIEISFPRGGRKPPQNANHHIQRDLDLFGQHKKKKFNNHVTKANIFQEKVDQIKENESVYVERLSTKTLQDGMILLGCVKEIQKVALEISLPGRLWGKVLINNISQPYTKLLQSVVGKNETDDYKQLDELFSLGQCVALKVLSINDEKFGITLSMMPQQINASISHKNIKKGMTLWGAINAVEDHGFIIDLGINNCRAFVRKENCETDYVVGQLLWFVVSKADVSPTATTVTLNAKNNVVQNIRILEDISLDHFLPGMQIDFKITKVLVNGLEGTFLNNYIAYVEAGQLDKSLRDKEFAVNEVIQARILYMMPVTKTAYLTLKSLEVHKRGKLKNGEVTNCKILGVTPQGVYIKLLKNEDRGFVPYLRAKKGVPPDNLSNFTYLKRLYRKQSKHKCRVLSFDYSEQIYICSLEEQLVDKNFIFSLNDLQPGQDVQAEIQEIQPNGLLVQVQQVNGFIKNEHICDTVLKNYNNIKSRFKVGQKIDARVWVLNVDKNILYLTMRPSLIKADKILTSYEEAEEKSQFIGVISQVTSNGLLVQFFGDVHGWVPKKKILSDGVNNTLFKVGQLIKCSVVNRKKNKLTLSLQATVDIFDDVQPEIKLGEHVDGIVSYITKEAVHVTIKDTDIPAFIPILYLSKFPNLAPILAQMYNPGDEISNLVCISKNDVLPTFSLRDNKLKEDDIKSIQSLKKGDILSCSVLTVDNIGINIEGAVEHFKKTILVPKENIADYQISDKDIKMNQLLYAKVLSISNNLEQVTASTKLSDVWNFDIQTSAEYFAEYLREVLKIRNYYKSLKNPVASLDLGEIVSGVVKSINSDNSCIVQLENGAKAFVQTEHSIENISVGDKVEGAVLFWNFEDNVVELTLSSKLIPRINHVQTGNINIPAGVTNKSNAHAEVILVKENYILGVLRGAAGKRQLIFFPTKLHPNDFKPNLQEFVIGDYININVNKIENGMIIGFLKQLVKDMNHKWKIHLKRKRALENNDTEHPKIKRPKLETPELKNKTKKKKNKESSKSDNQVENVEQKKTKKDRKKKNSVSDEDQHVNKITEIKKSKTNKKKNEEKMYVEIKTNKKEMKNKRKLEEDNEKNSKEEVEINDNKSKKIKKDIEDVEAVLPGADNFWNISEEQNNIEQSSEDEEPDEKELEKLQKKKKLTPAEKAEIARLEEERIRKIELELADAETTPRSVNQFDRLVLANPNNSMYWINYMAFHLEATEIEKARAIARKALNTIEFREEQEKLNVWFAFLNLENRYGTKELFASVLAEAVKMNDALTVYLQALNILSDSRKTTEFLDLVKIVSRKFKQEFKMWIGVAEACYKCNLKDEARNLMQRSLKSLDEKQHINLLVQFAFMESRHNEPERAEALLEKVLASYPRRVDVWTSYVDLLIKGDRISIARNVLERAVGQKLPARKMKTLFSKYIQFETKYGDEESVKKVRQIASNYVKTALN